MGDDEEEKRYNVGGLLLTKTELEDCLVALFTQEVEDAERR